MIGVFCIACFVIGIFDAVDGRFDYALNQFTLAAILLVACQNISLKQKLTDLENSIHEEIESHEFE